MSDKRPGLPGRSARRFWRWSRGSNHGPAVHFRMPGPVSFRPWTAKRTASPLNRASGRDEQKPYPSPCERSDGMPQLAIGQGGSIGNSVDEREETKKPRREMNRRGDVLSHPGEPGASLSRLESSQSARRGIPLRSKGGMNGERSSFPRSWGRFLRGRAREGTSPL
jgi:hypothetical protein